MSFTYLLNEFQIFFGSLFIHYSFIIFLSAKSQVKSLNDFSRPLFYVTLWLDNLFGFKKLNLTILHLFNVGIYPLKWFFYRCSICNIDYQNFSNKWFILYWPLYTFHFINVVIFVNKNYVSLTLNNCFKTNICIQPIKL